MLTPGVFVVDKGGGVGVDTFGSIGGVLGTTGARVVGVCDFQVCCFRQRATKRQPDI